MYITIIANFAIIQSFKYIVYLGNGGGAAGRGGRVTLTAERRFTAFLRVCTTGTGGFFKCNGFGGGGGGGGNLTCALAWAKAQAATTVINNTLIVLMVVVFN